MPLVDTEEAAGRQDLPRMLIADESNRISATLEGLFKQDFWVTPVNPESLDEIVLYQSEAPHFALYVSKGGTTVADVRIKRIRSKWPNTIVLLIMPFAQKKDHMDRASVIPAHQTLFRPCSKNRIVEAVENYLSLVWDDGASRQDDVVLSCLMEFIGGQKPDLYIAFNRVMPLIMTLCQKIHYDWKRVQRTFCLYLMLLSSLEKSVVQSLTSGDGRNSKQLKEVNVHIGKMVDLLNMAPQTKQLATDLKYVLKRYGGGGYPTDDVEGQNIPPSSRIIRILLDYHYLLQSGKTLGQALYILHMRSGWYDDTLLQALIDSQGDDAKRSTRQVYPYGLVAGMVIAEDIFGNISGKKTRLLSRNEILTEESIDYLQRHCDDVLDVTEPILIIEELFSTEGDSHV